MPSSTRPLLPPPPIVALASWVLPGLGYVLIGHRARGMTVGATIILLFVLGLLIGGIRVIEVPGYQANGNMAYDQAGTWALLSSPVGELRDKPWSILQMLNGPMFLVSSVGSVVAASTGAGTASHARVNEIGTLYTAVAGLLNLLAMIDASYRAGREAAK
jgi:hypothetical protein